MKINNEGIPNYDLEQIVAKELFESFESFESFEAFRVSVQSCFERYDHENCERYDHENCEELNEIAVVAYLCDSLPVFLPSLFFK